MPFLVVDIWIQAKATFNWLQGFSQILDRLSADFCTTMLKSTLLYSQRPLFVALTEVQFIFLKKIFVRFHILVAPMHMTRAAYDPRGVFSIESPVQLCTRKWVLE